MPLYFCAGYLHVIVHALSLYHVEIDYCYYCFYNQMLIKIHIILYIMCK